MGFREFLRMKNCTLQRDLIRWLIDRFDPMDGSIRLIDGTIKLNSIIFGKTLGVVDGGEV